MSKVTFDLHHEKIGMGGLIRALSTSGQSPKFIMNSKSGKCNFLVSESRMLSENM